MFGSRLVRLVSGTGILGKAGGGFWKRKETEGEKKERKKIIEANQRYGEDRKNLYSETPVGHVRWVVKVTVGIRDNTVGNVSLRKSTQWRDNTQTGIF